VVQFDQRCGKAAIFRYAPDEWVQTHIARTGRATAIVEVTRAEADDGAEGLSPGELRKIEGKIGIEGELRAGRAWSGLILVNEEQAREAHGIVTQVPAGGVVKGGASEGTPAKDEKIAAALQIAENCRPRCLGNDGTLRQDQKTNLRIAELRR